VRAWSIVAALALALLTEVAAPAEVRAESETWDGFAIGGGELNFAPGIDNPLTGHGWVGFDTVGRGIVGNGDLRVFWNTTKLHVGVERISFAKNKLAFFAFLEGEALISQLLNDYFVRGQRISEFGIEASYVLLHTKLQWYPGKHQTIELLAPVRRWWFGSRSATSPSFGLPASTWVFEPRLGYNYWNMDMPPEEWEGHRVFPRIAGVAVGINLGLDLRSDVRPWGLGDGRNDPGKVIYVISQRLRAGWTLGRFARLQLDQWGNYGWNQDDITRRRIGGVSPYVIPVPGLPWTGLISERLFAGQLGVHLKAKESSPHEFGLLVGGGAFNDVARNGALGTYGGAGGLALFGDLRFGPTGRFQLDIRGSWGFPVRWLIDSQYVSLLVGFGVRAF
jgi:hypothetical protein